MSERTTKKMETRVKGLVGVIALAIGICGPTYAQTNTYTNTVVFAEDVAMEKDLVVDGGFGVGLGSNATINGEAHVKGYNTALLVEGTSTALSGGARLILQASPSNSNHSATQIKQLVDGPNAEYGKFGFYNLNENLGYVQTIMEYLYRWDKWYFWAGGEETMVLNSNGMGIYVLAPTEALEVDGNATFTGTVQADALPTETNHLANVNYLQTQLRFPAYGDISMGSYTNGPAPMQ